ncbi:MAG TPA: hypothetical protein VM534_06160, partial [Thermoanaerobaculia bacterium]|nr:hypothetical protein [Thermoanaerobaculia bacterium]
TANPYSAGAMTPSPAIDSPFDTRSAEQVHGSDPDDQTMETRVSEISGPEATAIRPSGVGHEREPGGTPKASTRAAGGDPEEPKTEVRPLSTGGSDDGSQQEKTQIGGTAIRPQRPGTYQPPAADRSVPAPPVPEAEPTGRMRTAVMRGLRKFGPQAPDDGGAEPTIIEDASQVRSGQPPGAAPATARTAAYAPGAAPVAPGSVQPGESSPAAAKDASRPRAGARIGQGGLTAVWLPSGTLILCVIAAALLGHVGGLPVFLGIYLAAVLAWIWLLRGASLFTLKQAVTIGLLLRLGLLFIPPLLAADSLRGIWDGRMVANGLNPYVVAPLADEVVMDRPAWFGLLTAPGDPTTTPPWALLMYMVIAWIGGGLFLWKLILLAVELVTIRLLSQEKTGHAMMLYATCPLIALEGIWNGRVEVIVIALLMAASLAARRRADFRGGFFAGIGAATSFLALPALPALWGTAEKMLRMIAATVIAAIIPLAIFATNGRVAERLRDLLFGPELSGFGLVWLTERIDRSRIAESIAANGEKIPLAPLANLLGSVSAPDIAAMLVGVFFLVVLIVVTKRSIGPDAAVANCLAVFFLLTAVFSPAGWILLVPFAIAARQSHWILYALITPLAYLLPEEGTSWMLLATLYVLPPVLWLIFREDDGKVHLFDSAAGDAIPEAPANAMWEVSR